MSDKNKKPSELSEREKARQELRLLSLQMKQNLNDEIARVRAESLKREAAQNKKNPALNDNE